MNGNEIQPKSINVPTFLIMRIQVYSRPIQGLITYLRSVKYSRTIPKLDTYLRFLVYSRTMPELDTNLRILVLYFRPTP